MVCSQKLRTFFGAVTIFTLIACSDPIGGASGRRPGGGGGNTNGDPDYGFKADSGRCFGLSPFVDDWQEELGNLIRRGDADCVKKAIEKGARVNQPVRPFGSQKDILPIFYAMESSSLFFAKNSSREFGVIKTLVDAGASLDVKSEQGQSPLMYALTIRQLASEYPSVPGYLIHSGKAPLNERDARGETPLHITISNGLTSLAQQLINKGADLNLQNSAGEVAIQMALRQKNESLVNLLIDRGADLSVRDREQNTLLHLSIQAQMTSTTKKLIPKALDLNAQNNDLETSLYLAVRTSSLEIVQLLLAAGANADLGTNVETPLHRALKMQHRELSKLLLAKVKNYSAKDKEGQPLVYVALVNGDLEITQALMEKGVDLKYKDGQGDTLLHWAIEKKAYNLISALIERGVDVNTANAAQETALSRVVEKDDLVLFRTLVQKGASVDTAYHGQSLLLYAIKNHKSTEIVDYLIEKTSNLDAQNSYGETALLAAIQDGRYEQAAKLIGRGANPDLQDKELRSPLSLAVQKDQVSLVRTLIQKGARVGVRSESGQNLLHFVRSVPMATLLLDSRLSVDEQDNKGETPLSVAVRHGFVDVVRLFVQGGANIQWLSSTKENLLHVAVEEGETVVLQYLLTLALDVNAKNQNGRTPLFFARSVTHIELLTRASANINATDKGGLSVLAQRVEEYEGWPSSLTLDLVKKLLALGAEVNVRTSDGEYLLHSAVSYRVLDDIGHPRGQNHYARAINAIELLDVLLSSSKVNLQQKDHNDENALHKVDTPEEAERLMNAGISLNAVNKDKKQTPLQKKQSESLVYQADLEKVKTDITANEVLKEQAKRNGDREGELRLGRLLMEQKVKKIFIEGELITLTTLIEKLKDAGAI